MNAERQLQKTWRARLCLVALMCCGAAHADWVIPEGSSSELSGGQAALGCTDLYVDGTLVLGAGAHVTEVRNVFIGPTGHLDLAGGHLELAQQWRNQGRLNTGGGQVLRVDGPGCPAVGPLGPVGVQATPVPTLGAITLALLAAILGVLGLLRQGGRLRHRPKD